MENNAQEYEFVVEHHYGTVDGSKTTVLGKVKAKDAETAAKRFMDDSQKKWRVEEPKTRDAVTYYNPRDAVSDSVDRISAHRIK